VETLIHYEQQPFRHVYVHLRHDWLRTLLGVMEVIRQRRQEGYEEMTFPFVPIVVADWKTTARCDEMRNVQKGDSHHLQTARRWVCAFEIAESSKLFKMPADVKICHATD
jgi:hypothetical protein